MDVTIRMSGSTRFSRANSAMFYFFVHIILGVVGCNAAWTLTRSAEFRTRFPAWLQDPLMGLWVTIGAWICITSIPTSFIQFGFFYGLLTVGEFLAGGVVSGFLRFELKMYLALATPIIGILLMGAVWGWWQI